MDENPGKPKKIVARRSSILKKPNDADTSDCTESTKTKMVRRISFCGKKSVKEFIQDDEKNTVWGTSYEESEEKIIPVNVGNYDVTDMDIEEPLGAVGGTYNKENETPERTMWSTMNIASKHPLASSTMLDMQLDQSPVKIPKGNYEKLPSRNIKLVENDPPNAPFSWLMAHVDANRESGGSSAEQSTIFEPSAFSLVPMNTNSFCKFDISSFDLEPEEKERQLQKYQKKMQKEMQGIQGDGKHMKMTLVDEENVQKTLHPPKDHMELTNLTEATELAKKQTEEKEESMEMSFEMEIREKIAKTIGKKENLGKISVVPPKKSLLSMELTLPHEEPKIIPKETRKTIICSNEHQEEMEMSFEMEIREKIAKINGKQEDHKENLEGPARKSLLNMELTLPQVEPKKIPEVSRKTIYSSNDENQEMEMSFEMEIQEKIAQNLGKAKDQRKSTKEMLHKSSKGPPKKSLFSMDLTLPQTELMANQGPSRKTTYFPQDENQLDLTGITGRKSLNPNMDITVLPDNKGGNKRKTIVFTEENSIEVTEIVGQPQVTQEISLQEKITNIKDDQMNFTRDEENQLQKSQRTQNFLTIYFPDGDSPLNLTELPQQSMNITCTPGDATKTPQGGRKTIFWADKSMDVSRKQSFVPNMEQSADIQEEKTIHITNEAQQMEMTLLPDGRMPKGGRKTIYFSEDLNITKQQEPAESTTFNKSTKYFPEENVNVTKTSDMEIECSNPSFSGARRKTIHAHVDIDEEEVWAKQPSVDFHAAKELPEDHIVPKEPSSMDISVTEKVLPKKRHTIFFQDNSINESAVKISPFSRRESLECPTFEDPLQEQSNQMDLSTNGASCLEPPRRITQAYLSPLELTCGQSREHTRNFIEKPHFSGVSFKESPKECSQWDTIGAEEGSLISQESYIEAESIQSARASNSFDTTKWNLDNTYVRLGDNFLDTEKEKTPKNAHKIPEETFTVHRESPVQETSANLSKEMNDIIQLAQNSTVHTNETLASYPDVSLQINLQQTIASCASEGLPENTLPNVSVRLQRRDPNFLANFLESEDFAKAIEMKNAEKEATEALAMYKEQFAKIEPRLKYFQKYPSRCQLPKSLTFIELIENMTGDGSALPSVWFIDKYVNQGTLMFKHRKITTFYIYIFFDWKQLKDMDAVTHRGILQFRHIAVKDTDWYTEKDPPNKLWTYLHTKFRTQVLMDQYLINKYSDSNSLRDFLEYIDGICCSIWDARPPLLDLLRMYRQKNVGNMLSGGN